MKKIKAAVDKYRNLILECERYIWAHPETGYKEFKTNEYMKQKFEELQSPMGMINLDFAWPIMKEDFDETKVFRLNFGKAF